MNDDIEIQKKWRPSSLLARRNAVAPIKSWNANMFAEVTVLHCPCFACVNARATSSEVPRERRKDAAQDREEKLMFCHGRPVHKLSD